MKKTILLLMVVLLATTAYAVYEPQPGDPGYVPDFGDPPPWADVGTLCFPNQESCLEIVRDMKIQCGWKWGILFSGFHCSEVAEFERKCHQYKSAHLCKESMKIGEFYYCNIDNVVACQQGCDTQINRCVGDIPVPDCSEGQMKCGTGNVADPEGDVYTCKNGRWERARTCGATDKCVEQGFNNAVCEPPMKYCINNNFNCIKTSSKLENCYDTAQECNSNLVVYCKTQDDKCVKRSGTCRTGEREYRGTDLASAYGNCIANLGKECSNDMDCPSGFSCEGKECKRITGEKACEPDDKMCQFLGWLKKFWSNIVGALGLAGAVLLVAVLGFFGIKYRKFGGLYIAGALVIIFFVWIIISKLKEVIPWG